MLRHGKRSSTPMHATPTEGTKSPVHLAPGHHTMGGVPGMADNPAGGGGMPLPQGGPGGQPMPIGHGASAAMPHVAAPKRFGGKPGGRKMPGGY